MQSRYYDPVTHRFINADSLASTGQGILGYNMFVYCLNNPVNYIDREGRDGDTLAAWWASTMWWLCAADGAYPVGEIIYGLGWIILTIEAIVFIDTTADVVAELVETENQTNVQPNVWTGASSENYEYIDQRTVGAHVYEESEHTKGKRKSTKQKHQDGQARKQRDRGNEKGDARRKSRSNKRKGSAAKPYNMYSPYFNMFE